MSDQRTEAALLREAKSACVEIETNVRAIAAERDALSKEVKRLESLVFVPGMWKCPKCNFVLQRITLDVVNDRVAAGTKSDPCPNCRSPLWRVTERDNAREMYERCASEIQENATLSTRIAHLEENLRVVNEQKVHENKRWSEHCASQQVTP